MQGDILFYLSSGSLFDDLIVWRTHEAGTLDALTAVHCEIHTGEGTSTAALSNGVVIHAMPTGPRGPLIARTSAQLTPEGRTAGFMYLRTQVGDAYGWMSAIDDGLSFVLPHGPFILTPGKMTCSELATRFLVHAGFPLPAPLADYPELVTPQALLRALKDAGVSVG